MVDWNYGAIVWLVNAGLSALAILFVLVCGLAVAALAAVAFGISWLWPAFGVGCGIGVIILIAIWFSVRLRP